VYVNVFVLFVKSCICSILLSPVTRLADHYIQFGLHKFRKDRILVTTTFLKEKSLNFVQEPQEEPNARIIYIWAHQYSLSRETQNWGWYYYGRIKNSPADWLRYDHYSVKKEEIISIILAAKLILIKFNRLYISTNSNFYNQAKTEQWYMTTLHRHGHKWFHIISNHKF
jgi:hypothetical protein